VLEGQRLAAWTRFLKAHSAISRRLERDLANEHGLTLSDYDVLVQLSLAPGRSPRPVELGPRGRVPARGPAAGYSRRSR
jgi:DNA-binding MarR family transcriptional regulator